MGSDPQSFLQAQHDAIGAESLAEYVIDQRRWSQVTFGPGKRTRGITQHISKELDEIRAAPADISEWIDVIILAIDGYWRAGGDPHGLMQALRAKQAVNFSRRWQPTTSEDEATEHVR